MWVLVFTTISEQRRLSCIMLGKDDISVWSTRHFIFLILRTREGLHAYHNKIKIDHCRGNPFQACLSKIPNNRDWPRFCYKPLGLFIYWIGHNYPARLVHRILQGVEHTDPTEWSNSPFHWRQIHDGCSTNSQSFSRVFTIFLFNNNFSHSYGDSSATFHII